MNAHPYPSSAASHKQLGNEAVRSAGILPATVARTTALLCNVACETLHERPEWKEPESGLAWRDIDGTFPSSL